MNKLAILILLFALSSTTSQAQEPAISDFAWATFQQTRLGHESENLSYSPFSTAKALEILRQGLRGETKRKLDQVLAHENLVVPKFVSSELAVANAMWIDDAFRLNKTFAKETQEKLGVVVEALPFKKEPSKSAAQINDWVKKETRGLIPTLVQASDLRAMAALIASSLYIKGIWKSGGASLQEVPHTFVAPDGQSRELAFLKSETAPHRYFKGDQVEAVELPLVGDDVHFGILRPDAGVNFAQWQKELTAAKVNKWLSSEAPVVSDVLFPPMNVEADLNLNAALNAAGLSGIFKAGPDYAGISPDPVVVSNVVQKTRFTMDKKGIEAAAVTALMLLGAAMRVEPAHPVHVVVDRPYVFYLASQANAQIFFLGQFVAP